MSKNLNISILMDFYGQLLTDKQYDAMDLYYNQDLSLAEIAEDSGISRQGVHDAIKRGEKQLEELEEKLGLAARFAAVRRQVEKIKTLIDEIEEKHISPELRDKLLEIKRLSEGFEDVI